MSSSNRELIKVTKAIEKNFGVKFCTNCHQTKPVEGGMTRKLLKGGTRWECALCVAKKSKLISKGAKNV